MARRKVTGVCHLCGVEGPLSYEHVPPRAAFNDRRIANHSGVDIIASWDPREELHRRKGGTINQRGSGGYTLCGRCNNKTGTWYAADFVRWAYQTAGIVARSEPGAGQLYLPHFIFPLRVLKQVIAMFFSTNGEGFHVKQPELVRFILNKEATGLPPHIRVYCYLNASPVVRSTGVFAAISLERGEGRVMSEFTFPPFGFVMAFEGAEPDASLVDITHFAWCRYNDWRDLWLRLPVLSLASPMPMDYRSSDQILRDAGVFA